MASIRWEELQSALSAKLSLIFWKMFELNKFRETRNTVTWYFLKNCETEFM